MRLPFDRAVLILKMLVNGSTIRGAALVSGTEKKTVLRLLSMVGEGCERMLAELMRDVPVQDVECDALWGYVHCKAGTKTRRKIANPDAGDAYCFLAVERTLKLILAWHLGRRSKWDAHDFMRKLDAATIGRFQLSTDDWGAYPEAVSWSVGDRADYAMLVKEYATAGGEEARRYAPPRLISSEKINVSGEPEEKRVCTSHVERVNWTLRTHLRRLTRLSNGFSRKKANLRAALALYFAYYSLCRMHSSIRMTPAIKAGLTRKPWSMEELVKAAIAA